jgi:hypothetical protein
MQAKKGEGMKASQHMNLIINAHYAAWLDPKRVYL